MDNRWLLAAPVLATAISLLFSLWLGYLLQGKRIASGLTAVPLLLPPTLVTAYFVLPWFTPAIAVLAGCAHALPFLLRSARSAFQSIDSRCLNTARGLGGSEWRVFWRIALPLAWRPILAAAGIICARVAAELALVIWIDGRRPL